MRFSLIYLMNLLGWHDYRNEFFNNPLVMFLCLKKDKLSWNGWMIIGFILVLLIWYESGRNQKLNEIKNRFIFSHHQSLYQASLPPNVYKVSDLNCLNQQINHLLFTDRGIYLIQSLHLKGQLVGNTKNWLLEIHQFSTIKMINNPIKRLNAKQLVMKELMQLYDIQLPTQSYYVYDEQKLNVQLIDELKESRFIKKQSFKTFLKKLSSSASESHDQEEVLEQILYFIISMRYLEYLKGFYHGLSLVNKVELVSFLSSDSKQLLSFFISSSTMTVSNIHQFEKNYLTKQAKSLKVLQTKLFHELSEWVLNHPMLEFMTFNEEVMIVLEGFECQRVTPSEIFA